MRPWDTNMMKQAKGPQKARALRARSLKWILEGMGSERASTLRGRGALETTDPSRVDAKIINLFDLMPVYQTCII